MSSCENRLVSAVPKGDAPELSDEAIVLRAQAGETDLFGRLFRRYNRRYHQRIYRAFVMARVSFIEG